MKPPTDDEFARDLDIVRATLTEAMDVLREVPRRYGGYGDQDAVTFSLFAQAQLAGALELLREETG